MSKFIFKAFFLICFALPMLSQAIDLDISTASSEVSGPHSIKLYNATFDGKRYNTEVNFNMDGTWTTSNTSLIESWDTPFGVWDLTVNLDFDDCPTDNPEEGFVDSSLVLEVIMFATQGTSINTTDGTITAPMTVIVTKQNGEFHPDPYGIMSGTFSGNQFSVDSGFYDRSIIIFNGNNLTGNTNITLSDNDSSSCDAVITYSGSRKIFTAK